MRSIIVAGLLLSMQSIAARAEDLTPAVRAEHERTILIYSSSVIPSNPKNARSYTIRGFAYFALGQNDLALADYSEAVRFAPTFSDHYRNRARVYTELGKHDKALEDLNSAIRLSPRRGETYRDRARIHWELREYALAGEDYRQAVALTPKDAFACNSLAWFLIYCPEEKLRDEAEAVQFAQRACSLTAGREAAYVETLAAARKQLEIARQRRAEHPANEFKSLEDLLKQRPK